MHAKEARFKDGYLPNSHLLVVPRYKGRLARCNWEDLQWKLKTVRGDKTRCTFRTCRDSTALLFAQDCKQRTQLLLVFCTLKKTVTPKRRVFLRSSAFNNEKARLVPPQRWNEVTLTWMLGHMARTRFLEGISCNMNNSSPKSQDSAVIIAIQ